MNSHSHSRTSLAAAVLLLVTILRVPLVAADNAQKIEPGSRPVSVYHFVITNGVLENKKSATVRNVIEAISDQYPAANITVVGVENVLIENLRIQAAKLFKPAGLPSGATVTHSDMIVQQMPVEAFLAALVEASGQKIRVRSYGPDTYLISPPDAAPTQKTIEVFNLIALTGRVPSVAHIDEQIASSEASLKTYSAGHSRRTDLLERIERLKKQRLDAEKGQPVPAALIDKISDVVGSALQSKVPGDVPDFRYHPGSKLLIVTGSQDAIDLTRKVIAALEKEP